MWHLFKAGVYYFGVASDILVHYAYFLSFKFVIKPGGVMSDVLEVNTTETASLLSGIVEDDKVCDNSFALRKTQKN